MVCKKCEVEPVIILPNSNIKLCRSCFIKYFEKKVFKTIAKYNLVEEKDKIAVGVSGGKDSLSVLSLLNRFSQKKRNLDIVAIAIDEGIHGYREKTLDTLKKYCEKNNIDLHIFSYKNEFGYSLDEMLRTIKGVNPCSICGVLRRYLLNVGAKKLNASKLATGHNLDDEAQSIMMNQFRNNVKLNARLGPKTGVIEDESFVPRIKPLYLLTEKEVMTYAYLKGLTDNFIECPNAEDSYRAQVRDWINMLEEKNPGTKHSIVNSYLEIMPMLKKQFKDKKELRYCKQCNEPCSMEVCKVCQIRNQLKTSLNTT